MYDIPMAGTDRNSVEIKPGPAIILVRPQLGENIGAAARAMFNFGLVDMRLVAPRDGWPNPKAVSMAAGAVPVLDRVRVFDTTEEAIADLTLIYATTARDRDMRKRVATPRLVASELVSFPGDIRKTGILFGAERAGLTNEDVALARDIIEIPANPGFSSLNLAQAVLIMGYEIFGARANPAAERAAAEEGTLAESSDVLGFFEHLEGALDASGFLFPPEKRPSMVRNLRNLFHRAALTDQEVRTLRGVVKSLTTFGSQSGRKS